MGAERKPYMVCWQRAEDGCGLYFERVAMTEVEKLDLEARLERLFKEGRITDVFVSDEQGPPTPYDAYLESNELIANAAPEAATVIRALWGALSEIAETLEDEDAPPLVSARERAIEAILLAERFAERNPEVRKD